MIHKFDASWLEKHYNDVQEARFREKLKKKDAVLQFKDGIKGIYERALLLSGKFFSSKFLLIFLGEKGKGSAVLSLHLKQKRTRSQMLEDQRKREDEKGLLAHAREASKRILELEEQVKKYKPEMPIAQAQRMIDVPKAAGK